MIRLNVFFRLKDVADSDAFVAAATKLVNASRTDNGCVAYDVFASQTEILNFMICETWTTQDDLDAHMASAHFKELVPRLEQLATMKLEQFLLV